MIREPEVALAASPRDWAQRLHRHFADHGGARVRATVLHPHDALAERYDVLVVDDTTSFLTPRLLAELQRSGRRVIGVYDPDDPRGKSDLAELGVDAVVAHTAGIREFVTTVAALAGEAIRAAPSAQTEQGLPGEAGQGRPGESRQGRGEAGTPAHTTAAAARPAGRITLVGSPAGGCGATEVAVALAAALGGRGDACVLVDADEVAPSLAPRLGLPSYPNLRAAVDAVEHLSGALADALVPVEAGGFWALPGPARAADWPQLRAAEVVGVTRQLARPGVHVMVNIARCGHDRSGAGGGPAQGATRALLATADTVVGVGAATPVGVARLLEWVADVVQTAPATPLHLVVNRAPVSLFKRAEIDEELRRTVTPATLTFAPADRRVEAAAWAATVPATGAFTRALSPLAAALPTLQPPGGRQGRWQRRRGGRAPATPEQPTAVPL